MNHTIGTVVGLLVVALLLPAIALYAQAAVPFLAALLVFLAVLRLALPPKRRW